MTARGLPKRQKRRRPPIFLRVVRGGFEPANAQEAERLRAKHFKIGDVVRAEITKARNPRFHRLVLGLLAKVVDNQEALQTTEQLLTIVKIRLGYCTPYVDASTLKTYYVPDSIAFENMGEDDFRDFWARLCELVRREWFPNMSDAEMMELAEMMDP